MKAAFLLSLLVTASFETADAKRINHEKLTQTKQALATNEAEGVQLPPCDWKMTLYTSGNRGKSGGGPLGCYLCSGTTQPTTKKEAWERCYQHGRGRCECAKGG